MPLPFLPLALSVAMAPAPSGTARVELASTYDQATCASLLGDGRLDDGWDRAAIGEDAPAIPLLEECRPVVAQPLAGDCNDPLVSPWVAEMIGICDMPRRNDSYPSLRSVRRHDEHRAQRLLAELATQSDCTAPLGVPTPDHEVSPALLASPPTLLPPAPTGVLPHEVPRRLPSRPAEQLLRPPRV